MADTVSPSFHPGARVYPDGNAIILSGRQSGDTNDRFRLTSDGRRLVGDGTTAPPGALDFANHQPVSGMQTFPLEQCSGGGNTMSNQQFSAVLFTAEQTTPISNMTVQTTGTAAGATPTLVRLGIYTIAGTTATLVASTPNDTSLLASTNTTYTKALSTPYPVTRGVSYYAGFVVVTGAAAPTVLSRPPTNVVAANYDLVYGSGVRLTGVIASQADLPATFTTTSLVLTQTVPAVWFYLS